MVLAISPLTIVPSAILADVTPPSLTLNVVPDNCKVELSAAYVVSLLISTQSFQVPPLQVLI